MRILKSFFRDSRGATAVEYGLLTVLISVALIASVENVGGGIKNIFGKASTTLDNASR